MTTRWVGYIFLLSIFLVGCAAEDRPGDASVSSAADATDAVPTDVSPLGKWTVSEAFLYGEASADRVAVEVTIKDDGTAEWPRFGQPETIEFILSDGNPDGSIPLKTANSEDQISMGGAGPRNGLLRMLESGEMEIIECTSASEIVPKDFSEAAQKTALFMRLTRSE